MSILDHLADGDVDILAVLVSVGLWGLAPAGSCCWRKRTTAHEIVEGGNVFRGVCVAMTFAQLGRQSSCVA
jgi:hypothetical protein